MMSDHTTAIESAMKAAGFDPANPIAKKSIEDAIAAYKAASRVPSTFDEAWKMLDRRRFLHGHQESFKESLRFIFSDISAAPLPDPSVRIAFGLEAQGHIPTVENMLALGCDWQEIGRTIGWDGETAKQYYERHMERSAADVASISARYHRLHSICERILWTDLGAPAMGNPKTHAAMQELSELMLTDALIEASGRAALESKGGSDG